MEPTTQTQTERLDLDPRTIRALTQQIRVFGRSDGDVDVYSESGTRYQVDTVAKTCSCPDHIHRGVLCKHIRRAMIESGAVDTSALNSAIDAERAKFQRMADDYREKIVALEHLANTYGDLTATVDALAGDGLDVEQHLATETIRALAD